MTPEPLRTKRMLFLYLLYNLVKSRITLSNTHSRGTLADNWWVRTVARRRQTRRLQLPEGLGASAQAQKTVISAPAVKLTSDGLLSCRTGY